MQRSQQYRGRYISKGPPGISDLSINRSQKKFSAYRGSDLSQFQQNNQVQMS